jgi:hypothetical protein
MVFWNILHVFGIFMVFWNILHVFGIFYGILEYFTFICYILWPFGKVCRHLVIFHALVYFYPEKSGNPVLHFHGISLKERTDDFFSTARVTLSG